MCVLVLSQGTCVILMRSWTTLLSLSSPATKQSGNSLSQSNLMVPKS